MPQQCFAAFVFLVPSSPIFFSDVLYWVPKKSGIYFVSTMILINCAYTHYKIIKQAIENTIAISTYGCYLLCSNKLYLTSSGCRLIDACVLFKRKYMCISPAAIFVTWL